LALFHLGQVTRALSSGARYVPYKEHTLTKLLSDSLGGNAKTLVFVNVSPASSSQDETRFSLEYVPPPFL